LEHDDRDLDSSEIENLFEEFQKNLDTETRSTKARQELNKRMLEEEKLAEDATKLKDTPDMVNFLYGNITLDMFNKIKKLKALSKSPNEREAFLAYRKAIELCKQYNLDFDRIPCYVEGQENG
jgi:ligand-binding sensor domain-containing protein